MPKIVKLSDLSKKERKKVLEQTQKEVEERKAKIESEISFTSKNKSNNNIQLPIAKKTDNRIEKYTSSFPTSNNVNRNNVGNKQKEESKETFRKLNPNKKLTYTKTTNTLPTKEKIIEITSNIAKNKAKNTTNVLGNVGYGLANGLISLQQQFNRVTKKGINDRLGVGDNINSKLNLPTSQDMLKNMLGEDSDKPITNIGEKLEKQKQTNTENIQRNIDNSNNIVTKKLAEVAPSIGQMIPGMLPGIGATYFAGSASGNYYDEAKQRGMSEKEAERYSAIMGLAEGGAEALGGKITKSIGKNLIKGNAKQALKMFGLDVLENFAEEAIMEPLSEATATVTAGKDKADWNNIGKRMLQSGLDGAIVATIMGGASAGVGSSINIVNKIAKGEKVTSNDINTAKNDIQNNISADVQKKIKEAETIVNNIDNQTNQSTQQVQEPNKIIQNINQPNNITKANTVNLPVQRYQYQKSYNIKIDNLRQDASRYFNNSEKANNYVKMLEKIIEDKDIDIRLDGNLKTADGRIANGSYANGVITINPNSTRAGEFIAIHELTHAIGTDQMKKMIQTYRDSNSEFNGAVEKLLENYNISEINEEALSDISGQLFGNQEFINNLAQNNPNLFQRIYNEIKYLWHQFVGYRNQDQFINDLRYKWEQAYRNNSGNTNNQTQYSIAGRKAIENIKYSDPKQYDEAMNAYDKARRMAKKGIDNKKIIKATNWFKDKKGKWKFEFSDKDMQLKPYVFKKNFEYDLGDILEHDTLFKYYPELKGYKVIFTDLKGINGSHLRGKKIIKLDENKFDSRLAEEGTLIHEIQHAIQGIEGFSKGTTAKYGLLPYYRNLGEIEASDTKERMLKEKQGIKLREAPESSKKHPVHPDLKGMNAVDKARFYIYNSIRDMAKRGGKYSEEVHSIDKEEVANHVRQNTNMVVGRERITNTENSRKSSFSMPKVQKGYTRLYRGLENEYDSNYDKTKLDNSNGYESWTDNYELAKEYGNNVYYIDIPTTEIKNSVIDEDSNSETYGDRNLIYANDKPVGIKGKSGAEYMLYTDHDNYGTIKYNKVNNTSQDNQGRTLTKEQQDYFKDSKIKDRNGLLMTVYHGTNGEFNIFDKQYVSKNTKNAGFYGDGFYFTPDKESARQYGKTSKEVYLDIKNPFSFSELSKYNGEDYYSDYVQIKNLVELNSEWGNIPVRFNDRNTWGDIYEDVKTMLENNKSDEEIDNSMYDKYGEISEKINDRLYNYSKRNNYKTLSQVLEENGYDGIINREAPENSTEIVAFHSNQIKNVNNTNPTSNTDIRYSLPTKEWQRYLDENYKPTGTRTNLKEIRSSNKSSFIMPIPEKTMQDMRLPTNKKTLNPTEISSLNASDASTTPNLPPRKYSRGNKESSFLSNITTEAGFLNEDLRHEMAKEDNIRYYKGITNQETLEKAYNSLNKDGKNATLNWFNKESKNVTAEDVAKGWILLKQYQDAGDYQGAVEVAKKMREMGTSAGQATQAYNILSRLTPEGMFYYAQSELTEAYNQMVKGKSKEWIDKNASSFDLTAEETQMIMDTMQDVSTMEDGYEKKVKIAEIQKLISDKIPPTVGQSVKAWMRISMLFNPKTQVRNILGNAVILPVNMTSDFISSGIDKAISKKTGIRTTGNTNLKNYGKGFGKGLYESYNDFRKGINTRNIEGNRFEVSEGKSFKDKGIGKALNRVDNLLSFALDGGDRGFYEATFTNSINNQLVLNNTTEVTQEMIDIATNEALQRTWQDNNAYTGAVLGIRNILNGKIDFAGIHTKGLPYGLGDILIPFAKTPANLTKAIVDYSPVGLIKTVALDAKTFKNSLQNGQFTPQMQHKFVQNLGKGMAGSFLYVLGYALAKAGIASGEADDDKDVKNFMKNSLGISNYSIKIGNKTFTYDWAQPIATPLAIMTNYVKYSKENKDANIIEKGIKSLNIGTEQLLEQSFMQSLNTVLNGSGSTLENLSQSILELPARAIPTFSKQIADMVDGTQRTSFEYDKPVKSAINSLAAKIPVASKMLPVSRDTLGNEIKKYGGENNIFNVMFNPANVNKGELSKAGKEIYRLYQETGETSVFPITAPYYINSKGEKITMTAEQRSKYQKVTGDYAEKAISELVSNSSYKKLTDEKKAELLKEIISDSNAKAKYDILKIETKDAKKKRELIEKVGTKSYYDYKFKTKDLDKEIEKVKVLANANYSNKVKETIYESTIGKDDNLYSIMKESNIDATEYLKYKSQKFESNKKDDGTTTGKTVSGSKKKKVYEYVNNMDITYNQKLLLLGTQYSLTSTEKTKLVNYINNMNINKKRKMEIYDKISGVKVYKNGTIKW